MPCSQMMSMNISPPRATAERNVDSVPNVNARTRNSGRRNIGWSERRSTTTNAARQAIEPASSASTRGLVSPVGQTAVLSRLDRKGPASVSDLAAADCMRPQSMAPVVRDLEQAGLVSRHPDPDDGRRALVDLIPAGLEKLQTLRARR